MQIENQPSIILHAAIPNNTYILTKLDPAFGKLKIGYIKGCYSRLESKEDMGLDKIETTIKRHIEWGCKSKGRNFLAYKDAKQLQEFFDKYGDFTIKEMDVFFLWDEDLNNDGVKETYVVVLPFRTWSFKPSYATKIFGEIPSSGLRETIITKRRKANLPLYVLKRCRDTWLVNSSPITTIPLNKLNEKFYKFLLGKALMGLTVQREIKRNFIGRELK